MQPNIKTITKDRLENIEKSYNVKKIIGDKLLYRINIKIDNTKVVENVPALGCRLKEKNLPFGLPVKFNVFITPQKMHNAYYLLMNYELENFYFILDLVENVELPRINGLPQWSGFLNTLTKSYKTYFSFKEG